MRSHALIAILASGMLATLPACGSGDRPSQREDRELDEAERMLDEASENLSGIDENMLLDSNEAGAPDPPDRPGSPQD